MAAEPGNGEALHVHMEKSKQELNTYIYDFLVKSFFNNSAATFYQEAELHSQGDDKVTQDAPQSYLYEWWQIFWDLCAVRGRGGGSRNAQIYGEMWANRQKEATRNHAQELKAASLQQMTEDAGEYIGEEVDPTLLALAVRAVPIPGGLRKRVYTREETHPVSEAVTQQEPLVFKKSRRSIETPLEPMPLGESNTDYLMFASPPHGDMSPAFDFSVASEELSPTEINERTFNFLNGM